MRYLLFLLLLVGCKQEPSICGHMYGKRAVGATAFAEAFEYMYELDFDCTRLAQELDELPGVVQVFHTIDGRTMYVTLCDRCDTRVILQNVETIIRKYYERTFCNIRNSK